MIARPMQCCHVLDGQRLGIGRGILGLVGLAVAAHIPEDDPVIRGEGGDLRVPHPAGGAIAVAQQDGGAMPVILKIDFDAAAIEKGHAQSPYWAGTKGGAASRAPPRVVQRKGEKEAGTTSMFSCLIIMLGPPPEGGGQMPLARASSRMRKRSAASL